MERIAGRRRRVGVLSWGSNPLRRKVDRIEAGIFAGLLVMFLIGAPLLAVAAGWWEHGAAVAEQRAQRSVHLVTAVLLQDVPDIVAGTGALDAGALARWTASNGKSCVGLVLDTAGARAGSRLLIWVYGSGRQADPPLTRRDVRSRVITAAALALAAFAITLLAVAIWLRWLLNRRRLAGWGAAWADIGPRLGQARIAGLGPVTTGSAMTLVFISGSVAITVRDWEQRGEVSAGGTRTGLRYGEQAEGLNHRAGRWFHGLTGQRWPVAASGPVSGSYPVRERRASAISRGPATTTSVSASSKDELTADPAKRIAASWPTSPAR